jgi:hypothetical protein
MTLWNDWTWEGKVEVGKNVFLSVAEYAYGATREGCLFGLIVSLWQGIGNPVNQGQTDVSKILAHLLVIGLKVWENMN